MSSEFLTFDGSINVGQILGVLAVVTAGVGAVWKMLDSNKDVKETVTNVNGAVERVGVRLDGVDIELKKQTQILVALGEQGARLNNLETQVTMIMNRLVTQSTPAE